MSEGHVDIYVKFLALGDLDAASKVVEIVESILKKDYVEAIETDFWIEDENLDEG